MYYSLQIKTFAQKIYYENKSKFNKRAYIIMFLFISILSFNSCSEDDADYLVKDDINLSQSILLNKNELNDISTQLDLLNQEYKANLINRLIFEQKAEKLIQPIINSGKLLKEQFFTNIDFSDFSLEEKEKILNYTETNFTQLVFFLSITKLHSNTTYRNNNRFNAKIMPKWLQCLLQVVGITGAAQGVYNMTKGLALHATESAAVITTKELAVLMGKLGFRALSYIGLVYTLAEYGI
ncbi:hypothetical protein GCM10011416_04190 [Polaribacter pacificus]|uniref:Uncharacterized protein n=1 Tax=Polaribacter pacificus TaxID=1775173 RepID=A0A917HWI6_9FLAO|nr:hypothetical protein [Polaribacter pacificus]GGG90849.1 hypothetical protein GCM10011416_04190 [Polaribacter pacificus]